MRRSGEGPKIVQIETRYVETDAINFRDVVQSLTGKNSSTDWIGEKQNATSNSNSKLKLAKPDHQGASSMSMSMSMLMNNVSFKDLDRFLFELPPIDMPCL
ncbi:hypothetical protein SESBI_19076 [Sesbania bispinosa]|nr:hypothetical protein SESBI_19076 [Sesbania bispinosa]